MLTRGLMTSTETAENGQWVGAAFIAVLFFAILAFVALGTNWPVPATQAVIPADLIANLGTQLVTTYLLPFEAVSLLLLAALVGAIVIARE
jgi:NADH:ubiquinone oxidoreductase subunit 6 (subunit J)